MTVLSMLYDAIFHKDRFKPHSSKKPQGFYRYGDNADEMEVCGFLADNTLIYIIRNWIQCRIMRWRGEI